MVLGGRAKKWQMRLRSLNGKFHQLEAVGEGAYGKVVRIVDDRGASFVKKEEHKVNKDDRSFANEIETLSKLNHENIVRLVDYGMENDKYVIILEFVEGGSLQSVIRKFKDNDMPESMMRQFVRHMLHGLEYCHTHGVVHRDLKSANVLISSNGVAKLADFGGAKASVNLKKNELLEATSGLQATLLWMAPELYESRFSDKSDIWSLGCTMLEMATRKLPWAEFNFPNTMAALHFIAKRKEGPPIPENLSPAAQAFLRRCFIWDSTLRPSARELLEDEWLHPEGTSLSYSFEFSKPSMESSTGSEGPQGPEESMNEVAVKYIAGEQPAPKRELAPVLTFFQDQEEAMKRNWIWELTHPTTPTIFAEPLPGPTAPPKQLLTLDFLNLKRAKSFDDDF